MVKKNRATANAISGLILAGMAAVMLGGLSGCDNKETVVPINSVAPGDTVVYANVQPIFAARCALDGCHGTSPQLGLRLDSYAAIIAGSDHGPVVVAGDTAQSELYIRITYPDPLVIMPKPPNAPLSQAEIDLIRRWIEDGLQP